MKLLFELSKLHPTLPVDEIVACLDTETMKYRLIEANQDVVVVDVDADIHMVSRLAERLSLTFIIDEFLFSSSKQPGKIAQFARRHLLPSPGSIAIRCKNRSSKTDSARFVNVLADIYSKNRTVNLRHPENEVRAVVTDSTVYVGVKKKEIDTSQFEHRKAQFRPFFSPISLHPKIARALVNLSYVKKGKTLLDPFCGTGGILLEAGLLGIQVYGSDIEQKMIDGCKKTLEFYHIKQYNLYCCDIGEVHQYISSVDAIVTDFPYGRATTTKGENILKLYNRSFQHIESLLKKNGRAIIGLSNKEIISLGENYLTCRGIYPFRVHRSLTRYFVVYQK